MTKYDYVIKVPDNARVHDGNGFRSNVDIGIKGGRIVSMSKNIPVSNTDDYFTAPEHSVTAPGFVDTHAHFVGGVFANGVNCVRDMVNFGVTTGLDAGSAGPENFSGYFENNVVGVYGERVDNYRGLVNIAKFGLRVKSGEHHNYRTRGHSASATAEAISGDLKAIGAKVRIGISKDNKKAQVFEDDWRDVFGMTYDAARQSETFFMTHVAEGPPIMEVVSEYAVKKSGGGFVPRFVKTHCFHGFAGNIAGYTRDEWRIMEDEEVYFDVGQGQGSLSFPILQDALHRGFPIGNLSISSDMHAFNLNKRGMPGIVGSFPQVMTRFTGLMKIEDIITCSTSNPARAIGLEEQSGILANGRDADIVILSIEEFTGGNGPEYVDHAPVEVPGDLNYCVAQTKRNVPFEFNVQNVFLKGRKIV